MSVDINQSDIKKLENILISFKRNWDLQQNIRASKWRLYFLVSFLLVLIISANMPSLWWLNMAVIAYFAGSLFAMLRKRKIIYQQLAVHKNQIRVARLLIDFQNISCLKNVDEW